MSPFQASATSRCWLYSSLLAMVYMLLVALSMVAGTVEAVSPPAVRVLRMQQHHYRVTQRFLQLDSQSPQAAPPTLDLALLSVLFTSDAADLASWASPSSKGSPITETEALAASLELQCRTFDHREAEPTRVAFKPVPVATKAADWGRSMAGAVEEDASHAEPRHLKPNVLAATDLAGHPLLHDFISYAEGHLASSRAQLYFLTRIPAASSLSTAASSAQCSLVARSENEASAFHPLMLQGLSGSDKSSAPAVITLPTTTPSSATPIDLIHFVSDAPITTPPAAPSAVPVPMARVLCTGQDVPDEGTVAMIDEEEGLSMVGALMNPLANMIFQPVLEQVTQTMITDLEDNISRHVSRPVTADSPDMISAHVAKALIANLTNLLSDSVTEELTRRLTESFTQNFGPVLHRGIMDEVAPAVFKRLAPKLVDLIPTKISNSLPQGMTRSLPPLLATKLPRTLTQAVVPAVVVAVRGTMPGAWQFPKCQDHDFVCKEYSDAMSKYYIEFHSKYFGYYYQEYYAEYYTDALLKVDTALWK